MFKPNENVLRLKVRYFRKSCLTNCVKIVTLVGTYLWLGMVKFYVIGLSKQTFSA